MRHRKKFNHLSRKSAHRKALLRNLANALIEHKRINTTLAKAKALRVYVEPLITKAKTNSTHSRRVVFSYLQNKEAITELFSTVAEKVGDRPGGYLRIIKTGFRPGDSAEMAMVELVDFNEVYATESSDDSSSGGRRRRRRRRRGGGGGSSEAAATAAATEQAVEEAEEVAEDTAEEVTETVETTEAVEETTAAAEEAEETEEKKKEAGDDTTEEE